MDRALTTMASIGLASAFAAAPSAWAQPAHPSGDLPELDDVFYQIMPMTWRDADADTHRFGDLDGISAGLGYLDDLGVTALYLNPIFPSPAYHGYQHGRADQIDPDLGTMQDAEDLLADAKARGMKVFLDLVVYGISHDSPWFSSAFFNPGSPYDSWLAFTNGANTQYTGYTYSSWNGNFVGFIHWDLRTPSAFELVTGWSESWLDPNGDGDPSDGVDGFRLDHVWVDYHTGPDGWGYNLDSFWEPWKARLEAVNPDVFIFAEQADWGITGASLLTAFDAAMTKPFEFAARDALRSGNAGALYSSMASAYAAVVPGRTFVAILGDHDVNRLASDIGGGGFAKDRAAAAVLLTQPFPPVIYQGDEIAMLGTKQNYGSDANDIPMREPFKWNAVHSAPMTNYWALNAQAYNNAFSGDNDGRSVEEQAGVPGSVLETYRTLIGARHASIALRRGAYLPVDAGHPGVWAFVRYHQDQQVLVAINVSGSAAGASVDLSSFDLPPAGTTPTDLVGGASFSAITGANQGGVPLAIGAYGFVIAEVEFEGYAPAAGEVDGVDIPLDYPPAVATQDTPTQMGDNIAELNQMFARYEETGLRVGITGNVPLDGTAVVLMIDAVGGGQSTIDLPGYTAPPAAPGGLDGVVLDAGFEPETFLAANGFGGTLYVDQFFIQAPGAYTKTYRGSTAVNSGVSLLSGGTNPNAMQVALTNTNADGVTATDASTAGTATDGIEFVVPFSDLGLPANHDAPIRVGAFLVNADGTMGNQLLPGVGGALANGTPAPDLSGVPGVQWVTLAPGAPCVGDVDGDGRTSLVDFNILSGNFGISSGMGRSDGDLTGDGAVGLADFNTLAGDFGCEP